MDLTNVFEAVRTASQTLNLLSNEQINNVLDKLADEVVAQSSYILAENKKDLDKKDPSDPMYDRLRLTEDRLKEIAAGIREVVKLPSPIGRVLNETTRPNGLKIKKISVPFGVIGIIYEARPNVGLDVFSLCFKSGNACILKGGTDAHCSNTAIVETIHKVLRDSNIDENVVALMPAGRESTGALLAAKGYVDLAIPRGSAGLIRYVNDNAEIPVIETGAGICHTYFDEKGDLKKGTDIVTNAKTRRVSVCNSLDCLIINSKRLGDLPQLCSQMNEKGVEIRADERAYAALAGKYEPTKLKRANEEEDFDTEFLSLRLAIRTVDSLDEAMAHIQKHSSKHSEAIVTEDEAAAQKFLKLVDASCVYHNAPTSFTDGFQFGLGAEIGISTQKMHARGPMGLEELNTYKWIVEGNGQIRK